MILGGLDGLDGLDRRGNGCWRDVATSRSGNKSTGQEVWADTRLPANVS